MTKTYVIGRTQSSDIIIEDDTVSSRHLSMTIERTNIEVSDLGSSNGSFIDRSGQFFPLDKEFVIPQDVLLLGEFKITVQELLNAVGVRINVMPKRKDNKVSIYVRQTDGSFRGDN